MSIWIKNKKGEAKLAPHSYEKTLVAYSTAGYNEKLVIWLEGTNTELSFHTNHLGNKQYIPNSMFSICGGPIGTNAGIQFTKEQLQEIVDSMKDGAKLKIAACNFLNIRSSDSKYGNCDKTVEESFTLDNNMIQVGDNSFAPIDKVKEWLKDKPNDKIAPKYITPSRKIINSKL